MDKDDLFRPFNLSPFICASCNTKYHVQTDSVIASIAAILILPSMVAYDAYISNLEILALLTGMAIVFVAQLPVLVRYVLLGLSPLREQAELSSAEVAAKYFGWASAHFAVLCILPIMLDEWLAFLGPTAQFGLLIVAAVLYFLVFEHPLHTFRAIVTMGIYCGLSAAVIGIRPITALDSSVAATFVAIFVLSGSYLVFVAVRRRRQ